jgi:hypothetical protein
MAIARAMGRAARTTDDLLDGDAVAAGQGAALEVLEGDKAGGLGRGGEVAEDVLEEALVAGEREVELTESRGPGGRRRDRGRGGGQEPGADGGEQDRRGADGGEQDRRGAGWRCSAESGEGGGGEAAAGPRGDGRRRLE